MQLKSSKFWSVVSVLSFVKISLFCQEIWYWIHCVWYLAGNNLIDSIYKITTFWHSDQSRPHWSKLDNWFHRMQCCLFHFSHAHGYEWCICHHWRCCWWLPARWEPWRWPWAQSQPHQVIQLQEWELYSAHSCQLSAVVHWSCMSQDIGSYQSPA